MVHVSAEAEQEDAVMVSSMSESERYRMTRDQVVKTVLEDEDEQELQRNEKKSLVTDKKNIPVPKKSGDGTVKDQDQEKASMHVVLETNFKKTAREESLVADDANLEDIKSKEKDAAGQTRDLVLAILLDENDDSKKENCLSIDARKKEPSETNYAEALESPSLRRSDNMVASAPGAFSAESGTQGRRLDAGRLTTLSEGASNSLPSLPDNEDIPEQAPSSSKEFKIAEARPVDDEDIHQAEPVSREDDYFEPSTKKVTVQEAYEKKLTKALFLACAIFVLAGIGVAIGVVLKNRGDGESDSTVAPTVVIAATPTQAPTFYAEMIGLPAYTLEALEESDSAQSKALAWLMNDTQLKSYSEYRLQQRYALATFYFALGGENWVLNEDWLNYDVPECQWSFRPILGSSQHIGVYGEQDENYLVETAESPCDEQGRYQTLVFTDYNLVGTIPPEVSLLSSSLQYLNVGTNEGIKGIIPTEIGLLTELLQFYADRNKHTGPIPSELGNLRKLQEIDVGYNPFEGAVPSELANMESLRMFSIKRSAVTGFLPTELYRLTNLDTFFVHGCTGITGGELLPEMANMTKMQRFVAHDVPFNAAIPSEIGLWSDLWEFNIWNTQITGSLPSEFFQLTNMRMMDIDDNFLTGSFPLELGNFSNLTQAFMNGNQFTGSLPGSIFEHLGKLTLLKVNYNPMTGTIPSEVGLMSSMEDLWFAHTLFEGNIPSEVAEMRNLSRMMLHGTDLEGTLPSELVNLTNLEVLTMSNTSLTGEIPSELCDSVVDMEYTCTSMYGLYEICYDIDVKNFSCDSTRLCGCDCGSCM